MLRALGLLGTLITLAVGMYLYSLQVKTPQPSAGSTSNAETPLIAGVKTDLIGIANAERGYLAAQGKYASLDELTSGNYLTIKGERPPYVYDVELLPGSFRVTATRTTKGTPAQLWVSENMEIQSSD
jgi:hypothetical protein